VMEVICQEARNLTGAEDSSIFFLEDPGWLRLIFNLGGQPCHERIPVQGSLGGSALSQDRPLIANDPAAEREIYRPDHVPDNMMVVPLRTRGAAVGVLYLANKPATCCARARPGRPPACCPS
jgi:GAF domain-containing protein